MGTYIHAWGPQNRPETAVQSYCLRCRRLFLPTRSTVCKFCSTPSARPIVLKLCTHHPQTFVWLGDGLWGCLHACMPVCLYVLHAAYMLQGVHADYSLKRERETCRCAGMAYMHACMHAKQWVHAPWCVRTCMHYARAYVPYITIVDVDQRQDLGQ